MGILRSTMFDKFIDGRRIPFENGLYFCPDCYKRCRTASKMRYHLDHRKLSSRTGLMRCPHMPDEAKIRAMEKKRLRDSLALHLQRPARGPQEDVHLPAAHDCTGSPLRDRMSEPACPDGPRSDLPAECGCCHDGCIRSPGGGCGTRTPGDCSEGSHGNASTSFKDSATLADYAAHFLDTVLAIDDEDRETIGDALQGDLIHHLQVSFPTTATSAVLSPIA